MTDTVLGSHRPTDSTGFGLDVVDPYKKLADERDALRLFVEHVAAWEESSAVLSDVNIDYLAHEDLNAFVSEARELLR